MLNYHGPLRIIRLPVATFLSDPDLYGSISKPDQTKGRNGTRRHGSGLRSGRADHPVHWGMPSQLPLLHAGTFLISYRTF